MREEMTIVLTTEVYEFRRRITQCCGVFTNKDAY